jgi:hypothetical protein
MRRFEIVRFEKNVFVYIFLVGGVRLRTNPPPRSFSRQLACTSTDGNLKSDDEEGIFEEYFQMFKF